MADRIPTLNEMFQATVAAHGAKVALRHKVEKEWHDITYNELARQIRDVASGLATLGVKKGDRVALLSENRPEWTITDLAVLSLGGVVVPIYPTLPPPQIAYIVKNSGAKILVVSDSKQLKKALEARKTTPDLQYLIAMEPGTVGEEDKVTLFQSVVEQGQVDPISDTDYVARQKAVEPDDVASIVYTSGTTGDPKGAMLTHGNFVSNAEAAIEHFKRQGEPLTEKETFLSFLPMCHVFERTTGYYLVMRIGGTVGYSEGVRTLLDDMAEVKPTIMVCVPRVYESFQQRIQDTAAKEPEAKQKIFNSALEAGREYAEKKRTTGHVGPVAAAQHLVFDKMVYATLREKFGGNLRFLVSGGAPLNPETGRFFESFGIPIIEGYGLTETSPVIAANANRRIRLGTVGLTMPGMEVEIAPDGEIIVRGPNVMKGYWDNEVATQEVIDKDGWFHTGDIGIFDEEGYLKITDRKKDILVLVNGKKVAPQPIESEVKQSPFIDEIVLFGDKQNIVTALVLPNKRKIEEFAKEANLTFDSDEALYALPDVKKKIKSEIDAKTPHLADFEKIKRFTLISATFSVDTGELTPTLKVKRKVVAQKYASEIAAMGGGGE